MELQPLDWFIVVLSIVVSFIPAVVLARRAGSSTAEFFTSGRAAPWWLVGVSMVATTFSTDTPNLVTNLVRGKGRRQQLAWWAFLLTGMRRCSSTPGSGAGRGCSPTSSSTRSATPGGPRTFVRGFRAVYLGLFFNCVIMASVNLAAAKIANVDAGLADVADAGDLRGAQHRVRRDLGPLGRAGHRLHPVRHRDGRLVRGGLLRPEAARGRRAVRPGAAHRPRHAVAAPGFRRLGNDPHGAGHPAHRAVVVGLVSRRRAGRRELHRAADAGVEDASGTRWRARCSSTWPTTRCDRGPGSSSALASHPGVSRRWPTSREPSPTWTRG